MNCFPDDTLLHFANGDLSGKTLSVVKGHLKKCEHCRRRQAAMQQSWRYLSLLDSLEIPDDFRNVVWARIEDIDIVRTRRFTYQWMAMAAVLLLALGWYAISVVNNVRQTANTETKSQVIFLQEATLLEDFAFLEDYGYFDNSEVIAEIDDVDDSLLILDLLYPEKSAE